MSIDRHPVIAGKASNDIERQQLVDEGRTVVDLTPGRGYLASTDIGG